MADPTRSGCRMPGTVWLLRLIVAFAFTSVDTMAQSVSLTNATAEDLASGQRTFDAQCTTCHGAGGAGGIGPDLRRAKLRHAADDAALVQIIRNGIPGTDMPGFSYGLTDRAAQQTAAYVRSLGRVAPAAVPGDARRGAAVYESSGCSACHAVGGRGGVVGPELTAIAALRGTSYLRESVIKPEAAHPKGFLVVRAVTKSGKEIRGIRVIEDVFWIHLRDAAGVVTTLQKSELSTLERLPEASLMPSYESRLSPADLDDLIAYLSTLRGGQ